MQNTIDAVTLAVASTYKDWHLDLVKPETSVLFEQKLVSAPGASERVVATRPVRVPDAMKPVVDAICAHLEQLGNATRVSFDVVGLRFRGERIRAHRYALRLIPAEFLKMKDLKHSQHIEQVLLAPEYMSGGIILVGGDLGTGKTATAAATVVERLELFGGYALEVSSPIENEIEGFHGDGYMEQVDATENGYKYEVESAMRKFPAETRNIFFFGEVLEEAAAAEVVRLSGRGQLVVTTIAGRDKIRMIEMLVTLAERGGETHARELLGANLRAVVHQKLVNNKPLATGVKINESMRNIIKNKDVRLDQLHEAMDAEDRAMRGVSSPRPTQPQLRP